MSDPRNARGSYAPRNIIEDYTISEARVVSLRGVAS
jgi:hypothetical protein